MKRSDNSESGPMLGPWAICAIISAYLGFLAGLARMTGTDDGRVIAAGLILAAMMAIFWPSQYQSR